MKTIAGNVLHVVVVVALLSLIACGEVTESAEELRAIGLSEEEIALVILPAAPSARTSESVSSGDGPIEVEADLYELDDRGPCSGPAWPPIKDGKERDVNVNGYGFDFESDGEIDGPGGGLLGPSHDGSHSTSTANGTTTVTANAGTNEAQNADFDVTMEFNSETGKATISGTAGTYPEGHEKAGEPKPFEAKTVDVKCNESTGGRSIAFSDGGTPPKDITIAWNPNKDD